MWWFKKCKHEYEFIRNIYGDEINQHDGKRSEWKCKKCGKIEYRYHLQTYTIKEKLNKLYDEYYRNKYDKWCNNKSDILDDLNTKMIEDAKKGYCSTEFILICKEQDNDRNYYEKWFKENNLKVEIELDQKEKCLELNRYKFYVRWRY